MSCPSVDYSAILKLLAPGISSQPPYLPSSGDKRQSLCRLHNAQAEPLSQPATGEARSRTTDFFDVQDSRGLGRNIVNHVLASHHDKIGVLDLSLSYLPKSTFDRPALMMTMPTLV